jgi:hypothetical protein
MTRLASAAIFVLILATGVYAGWKPAPEGSSVARQGPSAAPQALQQASHLLVIVGLGGDLENADRFHQWAVALVDAARGRYGLPAESVIYLGEDPSRDPARISGRSTREGIATAIGRIAAQARPGDRVLIVLIGHGASATGGARFNLPGPDLTAPEFAKLLDRLAAQSVVFANTASASGGFVAALSGRDRTIITATKTDGEKNQTRFGEFFVAAFAAADAGADADKDGRVSLLEAFLWARARVADSYSRDGQLLTEHAVLDDNGDRKGSDAPGQPGGDGALARTVFLSAASTRAIGDLADPELRALVARRNGIEAGIAALKAAKDDTDPDQYERDLERMLVELARVTRAIREKQK